MTGRTYQKAIYYAIQYVKAAKNGFIHEDWAAKEFNLILDKLEELKNYYEPPGAEEET